MEMWPSIFLSDITMYIMANHPGNDVPLQQRLLNEYKEGKAYRLYTGGWLKEIFYHAVSQHSEYCFLKANCCHTMKIGDVPHTVWICVVKKTGDIKSAYCSCTAGLGCSCIHITAMFFRVEAAVRTGQTNVACTSKLCQWNIPAKKTHIEPLRVKDMDFKVSKFSKVASRPLVDRSRKQFRPDGYIPEENEDVRRSNLLDILQTSVPNGCYRAMRENKFQVGGGAELSDSVVIDAISEETKSILLDDPKAIEENEILKLAKLSDTTDEFLSKLKNVNYSDYDIHMLESKTVGQHCNSLWRNQRIGRLTASKFYSIYTKVNTIKNHPNNLHNIDFLLKTILGHDVSIDTVESVKHGRTLEPEAKKAYIELMKSKHEGFGHRECGLFVDKHKPYLGASPDLVVSCKCCEVGLMECKCPFRIRHSVPSVYNLDYIQLDDSGSIKLKRNHLYFAQIQGQMAITGTQWCDLFIFTFAGNLTLRVNFDEKYWSDLVTNLDYFFNTYVANELLSSCVCN
ncbi:uncharacterized protein [Ptychodera flava]|uniref:uncharacterized protein isoform X1 n=1 Tax=Ptychodera flava TaxID=63121 RepID=UPI00396A24A4